MNRIAALAVAIAIVAIPSLAHAQSSASQGVDVTANVIAALTLTSVGEVAFGDVPPGAATVGLDAGAAFTASGEPSAEITVNRPGTLNLEHDSDALAADLVFTADFQGHSADDHESASAVSDGASVSLNASGDYYFWLGGSLVVPVDATPGAYAGEYTVSVEYN